MEGEQGAQPRAPGEAYGARWSSHVGSRTRQRIRREVYGDEYPEEVDPRGYLTWTELRRIARELRIGAGDAFVDLGCGQGGPGLWVARETGATVVGIDVSSVGIARAAQRAREWGLAERARFEVADVTATGLPDASFDRAVADKAGALHETARILKPSARFAVIRGQRTAVT